MESDAPSPGQQARYEIRSLIGSGGAGKVFKAWDSALRRYVAIKRFGPELGTPTTEDERAWREAMTLASIQHPNILTVFDFGVDEQGAYVITEFLEGETLDVIAAREPFPMKPFRELVRQTLEGLIAAHQIGLIHRDLKPQNIMVSQLASGALQFKILDFGLAKILQEPQVQTMLGNQSIVGSIFYITPEQLSRHPVDERSDLYAMGCVYYFALTGKQAFEGNSITEIITSHIKHRVAPLHQKRPDLQPVVCDWVMKLMNPHPEHRYQSAAEALTAFQKIPAAKTILISSKSSPIRLPDEPVAAPPPEPPPAAAPADSSRPPAKKNRVPAIVSSVVLAVVLLILGIRSMTGGRKSAAPVVPAPIAQPPVAAQPARAPAPPATPAKPSVARLPAATTTKPAPRPSPSADELSKYAITAEIIRVEELDKLRERTGREVALRGRVLGVRSKGEEMLVDFEGVENRVVSLALPLSKENRASELKHARGYKGQMVCVQGVVEARDGAIVVRGRNLLQLDILPPL